MKALHDMIDDNSFLHHPERRQNPRLDVSLPVSLKIGDQLLQATASNLSCGGIFLPRLKDQFADSVEMELQVHLPGRDKPVTLCGEVAREEGDGVGVKFKGLYDDNILAIEKFIKNSLH